MNTSYRQIVCTIAEEEPSPALCEKIMLRIEKMEKRRMHSRATLHGSIFLFGFVLIIPAFINFLSNITNSEMAQYVSLIALDWSTLAKNWSGIMMSVAEAWPVLWSTLILGSLIILADSLRRLIIDNSALSVYKNSHVHTN